MSISSRYLALFFILPGVCSCVVPFDDPPLDRLSGTLEPCGVTSDCVAGHECSDEGLCLLVNGEWCSTNEQCHEVCIDNTCRDLSETFGPCDSSEDCVEGHTCWERICLKNDHEPCQGDDECLNQCISSFCLAFSWRTLGPTYWQELQRRLLAEASKGSSATADARLLTQEFTDCGDGCFQGAVLAPNGRIYGIPRSLPHVAELQAGGGTAVLGPDLSLLPRVDKWYGAVLAFDGLIYAVPSDESQALRFDPDNADNAGPFGQAFSSADDPDPGSNKWKGTTMVPNGRIIACPRNGNHVLEIDLDTAPDPLVREVGPDLGSDPGKYSGAVLGPNGRVYCIPHNAWQILEIDPDDLSDQGTRPVGPVFSDETKWAGGALAPNGKIYAFPYDASHVLEIEPDYPDDSRMVGPDVMSGVGGPGWESGALAPDGRIYAPPSAASEVLVIDYTLIDDASPLAYGVWTFEVSPDPLSYDWSKFYGAVLAPDGKIYSFPWFGGGSVLVIDPHANGSFDEDLLLNGHLNGQ